MLIRLRDSSFNRGQRLAEVAEHYSHLFEQKFAPGELGMLSAKLIYPENNTAAILLMVSSSAEGADELYREFGRTFADMAEKRGTELGWVSGPDSEP